MERLCTALGEDLNSPVCTELKEHLESCPDCTLQLDSVRRTVEIYRSIPCAHVPGEMQKRLLARLNLPLMDLPEDL
ncbi:MAG: hypothetical protein C4524_08080 [Candidatus Zixiibacteriota bacterium]|nr:MAG: hypothetical protein C4524_08080 [candidate division Zixibacteria bacterium]